MKNKITYWEGYWAVLRLLEELAGVVVITSALNKISKHKICNALIAEVISAKVLDLTWKDTLEDKLAQECFSKLANKVDF